MPLGFGGFSSVPYPNGANSKFEVLRKYLKQCKREMTKPGGHLDTSQPEERRVVVSDGHAQLREILNRDFVSASYAARREEAINCFAAFTDEYAVTAGGYCSPEHNLQYALWAGTVEQMRDRIGN